MSRAVQVGVAALRESGPHAFGLRSDWSEPVSGHGLVTADRVVIHLENVAPAFAEPLHAWVTTDLAAVGVGRVTAGDAGWVLEGEAPDLPLEQLTGIWVTTGAVKPALVPLLEGALVWLPTEMEAEASDEGPPDEAHVPEEAPLPDPEPEADEESEPVVLPLSVPDYVEDSVGPEDEAPSLPEAPPATTVVTLSGGHPSAPRAAGSAALELEHGSLTLVARGLPAPAALGQDPVTGRPYNAYRVWLMATGGRQRLPAGLCTRVWGEHFRCQIDSGLPLAAYDMVVVAPADRGNPQPAPGSIRVLEGRW